MSRPTRTTSAALLVLRVALGAIFLAHGWQKFFAFTIPGTQGAFAEMGVPAAELIAPAVAALELAGGAALILGLATRPVALLLALDMAGALLLVHLSAGIFVDAGGYELVLALGAGALALAIAGPGSVSADRALFGSRRSALSRALLPAA